MTQTSIHTKKVESIRTKLFAASFSRFGVFAISLVTQIVIARTLGPAGKGMFSLAVLTASVISVFAHFSLSSANAHFAGRNPEHRLALVGNSFFIAIVWGMAVTLLLILYFDPIRLKYIPKLTEPFWWIALVAIVPMLLFEFSNGLVLGMNWIRRFSLIQALKELLILAGIALISYLGMLTVEGAVSVWVIAIIVVAVLQAASAWYRAGKGITISVKLLGKVSLFSLQAHIANLSSFLRMRVDVFMIAYFLPAEQIGYYTIAIAMIAVLWYIPEALTHVLIPHISTDGDEAGNQLTPMLARLGFSICLTGAIVLAIFGWLMIRFVFGEPFVPAYIPLLTLLPGAVVYGLGKVLAGDLLGRGKPVYAMIISFVLLIVNVGCNLIFIPKFGIVGAAMAASLTQISSGALFLYSFKRRSKVSMREMFIFRTSDFNTLFLRR